MRRRRVAVVDSPLEQCQRLTLKVELAVGVLRDQPCRLCTFIPDERSSWPAMLGDDRSQLVGICDVDAGGLHAFGDRQELHEFGGIGRRRPDALILGRHSGQLGREPIHVHHMAGLSTTAHLIHHLAAGLYGGRRRQRQKVDVLERLHKAQLVMPRSEKSAARAFYAA
jgi:hypothetical protein